MHTVIVSDLHILGNLFNARLFLSAFKNLEARGCKRFIINGDAIEKKGKMKWYHLRVILRLLEMKENGIEIIRVKGNHDSSGKDIINKILGIPTLKKYCWEVNGRVFCAIHGNRFDWTMFFNNVMCSIFLFFQKCDSKKQSFVRFLDWLHGKCFGLTEAVAWGAVRYAHRKKTRCDVIFCGHTHQPVHFRNISEKGHLVNYYNSGDWLGKIGSFITVNKKGVVNIRTVHEHNTVAV